MRDSLLASKEAAADPAVFQNRHAPNVLVVAFGHAESVQKDVDVPGAVIRAVPVVACVKVEPFF